MDNQPPKRLARIIVIGIASLIGTTPFLLPATLSSHVAPLIAQLEPETVSKILLGMIGALALSITWIILIGPHLKWDERTGTWKHRFNETRYCAKCRAEKRGQVPLKNKEIGWYCMVCHKSASDPDRQGPPAPRHRNPYN